jgi:hypothetical protein
MQINGNLQFSVLGSGELQNAIIERLASAPTGAAGRIYYDTTSNAYFYYNGTSWQQFAAGTTSVASLSFGTTGLTPPTATTGPITVSGTLVAVNGGTGFNSYTAGNLLYASSTTALSNLAPGTANQVLHSGTTPAWGPVDLAADVDNVLPPANGGTGVNNGSSTITLGGNLTTGGAFTTTPANAVTLTTTGATNVTLPTSGTLLTSATAVASLTGTANQITVSSPTGSVTLSIPSTFIAPGSIEATTTLQVDGNTAKSFVYSDASKLVTTTAAPLNGEILIGSTGNAPVKATISAGTGMSVVNGAGTITLNNTGVTSVTVSSSTTPGLTVTNPTVTTTGTITLALGADLVGLEALGAAAQTGIVVRTGAATYISNVAITGTSGNITVANGDGVAANPTLNLATVGTPVSNSFVNISTDAFGRVTATTAVTAGQLETMIGTYYLPEAGGTMSGSINMGGNNVTNVTMAMSPANSDVATVGYVNAATAGLNVHPPVDTKTAPLATDTQFSTAVYNHVAQAAPGGVGDTLTGTTAIGTVGGYAPTVGARILVDCFSAVATGVGTTWTANGIYVVTTATSPFVLTRSSDANNSVAGDLHAGDFVLTTEGTYATTGWVENQIGSFATPPDTINIGTDPIGYVQFSGAGTYTANTSTGLGLTGTTFFINQGAGLITNPATELGINLYTGNTSAAGALWFTNNGTSFSDTANAGLYLKTAAAGGLTQDATGLYIQSAGVTNAMLANPSVPVDVDGVGTTTMTLGTTFNFFGTANRIQTTATANTVTINIDANYAGQATITTLGTVATGTWAATTIAANHGGTGQSSYAVGDILYADSTSTLNKLADVAAGSYLRSGGVSTAPLWSTLTLPNAATTGDILYATGSNAVGNLAVGTNNQVLLSNGTIPTWGQVSLTAGVTGTLPATNGGTGHASYAVGDLLYASTTTALSTLAVGGANTVLHGGTTPSYSAVSLTADVSGVLPVANGGTNLTSVGAAGTVLASTGSANAYKPIQFSYDSTLNGGSNTSFTVTHNLNQKFVNVTVYDSSFNQIIPQSVVLNTVNQLTVTVNSAINLYVVVMGITGVALA